MEEQNDANLDRKDHDALDPKGNQSKFNQVVGGQYSPEAALEPELPEVGAEDGLSMPAQGPSFQVHGGMAFGKGGSSKGEGGKPGDRGVLLAQASPIQQHQASKLSGEQAQRQWRDPARREDASAFSSNNGLTQNSISIGGEPGLGQNSQPRQLSRGLGDADQKAGAGGAPQSSPRASNKGQTSDPAHPYPSVSAFGAPYQAPERRLPEEAKNLADPAREMGPNPSIEHQFISVNDVNIQSQQFADSLPKFERGFRTPQQPGNSNEERVAGRPNGESKVSPGQIRPGKLGGGTPAKGGTHVSSNTKARQISPKRGFGVRNAAQAKPSHTQRQGNVTQQQPQHFLGLGMQNLTGNHHQSAKYLNPAPNTQNIPKVSNNFQAFINEPSASGAGNAGAGVVGAPGRPQANSNKTFNQITNEINQNNQAQRNPQPISGARFSIIDGGASAPQISGGTSSHAGPALSVVGGGLMGAGTHPTIGRRLDQVASRRRRTKTAKNMKVLYHYLDGILSSPSGDHDLKDNSMEFDASPSKSVAQQQSPNKKLKAIDVLIDLKISIEKVEKNVILAEDGNLYLIESAAAPGVGASNLSQYQEQPSAFNESQSHNQSQISHSGGFAGQYGTHLLNNASAGDAKVSILPLRILKESDHAAQSEAKNSNDGSASKSPSQTGARKDQRRAGGSGGRNDKIKDIAVAQNGLVYTTEKGEVYLAISQSYYEPNKQNVQRNWDVQEAMDALFQQSTVNVDSYLDISNSVEQLRQQHENVPDAEDVSISDDRGNDLRASHNQLRELDVRDVNIGEQFDNHQILDQELNQSQSQQQAAISNYGDQISPLQPTSASSYSFFHYPMVAKPMKQIQSTYISRVACGLEHALLLTSSGFVYSMGRNGYGQLGREQQNAPDLMIPANDGGNGDYGEELVNRGEQEGAQNHNASAPQMIFTLLNTKVTDIQCGFYHNVVVGTPRSSTAAMNVGMGWAHGGAMTGTGNYGLGGQRGTLGGQGAGFGQNTGASAYSGYSAYQTSMSKQKQMVFSWGCNKNHQLGLFQLQQDQVEEVHEPTLIEELLQFDHIRKVKCQDDKTMILVDDPNTLLVFSKRDHLGGMDLKNGDPRSGRGGPAQRADQRDRGIGAQLENVSNDEGGEANVEDSPERHPGRQIDERDGGDHQVQDERRQQRRIEQSSVHQIAPDHNSNELIVDFELIERPLNPEHYISQTRELSVLYSTNLNDIYLKQLSAPQNTQRQSLIENNGQEPIYNNQSSKCLIQDHYISKLFYFSEGNKVFAVSQLRPDLLHQSLLQEQRDRERDQQQQQSSSAGAQGGASSTGVAFVSHQGARGGSTNLHVGSSQQPQYPYPFHQLNTQNSDSDLQDLNEDHDRHQTQVPRSSKQNQSLFGNSDLSSVPRTLGNVFSQEWRDLLKFIAVSKGSTQVPQGLEPMTYRPQNLPQKSEAEKMRVNQLVEENRQQYMQRQKEKQLAVERKLQRQLQKEDKLAKIWEKEILDDWDNLKSTARVRELWTEGIPKRIRSIVWYRAVGNKSVVTKDLFNIMAERGRKLSELLLKHQQIENDIIENRGNPSDVERKIQNLKQSQAGGDQQSSSAGKAYTNYNNSSQATDEHDSDILEELYLKYYKIRKKLLMLIQIDSPSYQVQAREKSISLIEQDIKRTFADLNLFQEGMKYHENIFKILRAFAMYRPDIGYVQGMSYIAGIVLLYIQDEYKSFMNFSNLMLKYPIMPFYTFNEEIVTKVLQLFKQLFQINLPDLCDHFEMEEIKPRQYVYKWVMTLFSTTLPLRVVSHVWDLYFLDGIFILYQTSIAILRLLRPKLLQEDMEGIMQTLQHVPEHITEDDEEKLVDSIFNMVYPQWVYEEIPKLEIEYQKLI